MMMFGGVRRAVAVVEEDFEGVVAEGLIEKVMWMAPRAEVVV